MSIDTYKEAEKKLPNLHDDSYAYSETDAETTRKQKAQQDEQWYINRAYQKKKRAVAINLDEDFANVSRKLYHIKLHFLRYHHIERYT